VKDSTHGVRLDPDQPAPDLDPEQHFGHEEEDPWKAPPIVATIPVPKVVHMQPDDDTAVPHAHLDEH
jgi:hypothetical protein